MASLSRAVEIRGYVYLLRRLSPHSHVLRLPFTFSFRLMRWFLVAKFIEKGQFLQGLPDVRGTVLVTDSSCISPVDIISCRADDFLSTGIFKSCVVPGVVGVLDVTWMQHPACASIVAYIRDLNEVQLASGQYAAVHRSTSLASYAILCRDPVETMSTSTRPFFDKVL